MKPLAQGLAAAFGGLAIAGAVVLPAHAQQAQQAQQLERVEVTGSNIRRTDTETASPVVVITAKDIQESGAVTIADVLAKLPIAGSAVDDRLANGFTPGAGNVDLRGIGPQNTLILLNGRRVGPYAFGNRAASTQIFQDIYALPINDVDRIEVLKDGASAIYGADAVGGVINFITRRDFTGMQAGARLGINEEGDGLTYGVNFAAGFGSLGKDKYNLYVNFEYTHEDEVYTIDRPFAANEDFRSRGGRDARSSFASPGTYTSPATLPTDPNCSFRGGFCRENRPANPNNTLQPKSDRMSGFARLTYDISPNLQAFGEVLAMRNVADYGGFGAAADRYRDPVTGAINTAANGILIPAGYPGSPFPGQNAILRWRFDDVGGQGGEVTSDRLRFLAGLKGTFGQGWEWETAAYYDKGEVEEQRRNQVTVDTLAPVIAAGTYSFTGPNSESVLSQLRYGGLRTGESTLTGFDVKASNTIYNLPAGLLGMAIGYNYFKTEMRDTPDPASAQGAVLGSSASAGFGEQDVNAVFIEFNIPVVKGLEAIAALRYDRYGGNGSFDSTSPKLGAKWNVNKELMFRATWSEAFRAPSVYETSPASQTSFDFGLSDPVTCVNPGDAGCNVDVRISETGNPQLKPEKSNVWNVGLLFEPIIGTSIEIDYFDIRRKDEISSYDNQTLLDLFATNPAIVIRDPVTNLPATIVNTYVNVNKSVVTGWDFGLRSRLSLKENGALRLTGLVTYYTKREQETLNSDANGQPVIANTSFLGDYEYPRFRSTAAVSWDYGAWSTTLRNDYVGKQLFFAQSGKIGGESYWGLNLAYQASKAWTIVFDVANLLDEKPSYVDDTRGSYAGFSPYFGDPYGRRYLISTRYIFK